MAPPMETETTQNVGAEIGEGTTVEISTERCLYMETAFLAEEKTA